MVITYYEPACIKIQSRDFVLVFDPPSKNSVFKTPRFQADIICVSHNHSSHNGVESISGKGGTKPVVCDGPGEYEIAGTHIYGILTSHADGHTDTVNVIYISDIEGMRLAHFGAFGEKEIRPEVRGALGDVDILCMPIDGDEGTSAQIAAAIAAHLGAKIVIPVHYDKKSLAQFSKDLGSNTPQPLDKLTIKIKDIQGKSGNIVVLK